MKTSPNQPPCDDAHVAPGCELFSDPTKHAPSPAPASEGRSEEKESVKDMTTAESGVISAASEFIRDWRKGDFTLPPLAVHDATHLENTLLECKKKPSTNLGPTPSPSECKAQHAVDYFTKNRPVSAAHYPGAGVEADKKRLDWLERFLQMGGTSVSTTCTGQAHETRPDDTEESEWNHPFSIGYQVETEHRGCYRWEETSNGCKHIRGAIDAAMAQSAGRDDGRGGAT